MEGLAGNVALVTGAGGGIGRAIARRLAKEGAKLVLTDIELRAKDDVLRGFSESAVFLHHAVASETSWADVIAESLKHFGQIDILVNNAALIASGNIEDTSLTQWQAMQRVNADGVFLGCHHAVRTMKANPRGGVIVNLASLAAVTGLGRYCAYSASKGAVTALTRSVAAHCRDAGYRIRCNAVIPGAVLTQAIAATTGDMSPDTADYWHDPRTRYAMPEDIASLVAFLASDDARFITGSEVRIDNGQLFVQ
ncbi:SDR family oxidoreductase [Pandoraea pneumonica]|uniref:SDR family oxidoreductase n=1 Tax=Pandoraea pneumonica TaxID=2508299 RepID=UPI003CF537BA